MATGTTPVSSTAMAATRTETGGINPTDLPKGGHKLVRERLPNYPASPQYRVRYYDATDRELWSTTLCCAHQWSNQFVISDDGSVVALLDVPAGEYCEVSEDDEPTRMPPECLGLRVFTAGGEAIVRSAQGGGLKISPNGRFIVFREGERIEPDDLYRGWFHIEVATGKRENIPPTEQVAPSSVNDKGVVSFGWSPGKPRVIYRPGKGMEVLPNPTQEHRLGR